MSKHALSSAGISEHVSAVAHDLLATAMGGFLLPAVIQLWQHFLRHKPPEWATNPVASALAAVILIPALLVTRRFEGRRTVEIKNDAAPSRPQVAPRNEVLAQMRRRWVAGELNKPLYRMARIALGMQELPGAFDHSTGLTVSSGGGTHSVAPATSTISLLDELRGFVLLGAPGAGKTMLLAELVRDLLDRADNELTVERADNELGPHIPVAFKLGTWTSNSGSIEDWVISELAASAPGDVIREWFRKWQITLILDALDEVRFDYREACVAAINQFRHDHPSIRMVVSCRSDTYEQLATKPNLHAVVVVCPLTRDAIDSAVEHAAEELQGLRDALQHAPQLYEVLSSPLMLDVARIAYSSRDWTVPAEATVDELQQRLFDKYTDHMLNPETPDTSSTKRVRNALRWIASNMKVRGYLYFDRDNVTSLSWLPRKLQYRAVTSSSFLVGMRVCFFFATICGAAGFALGSIGGSWLGYGLGITAALVSVSVGVFLTIVAIFIWPTYEDRISDYFDLIYQSKAHESKQALALRARTESVERSVRDWVLRRRWAGCFLRLLYFAGRGTTWLLAWAKRAFIITLVLCCILLFPIGAVIGFVVGPLISYLLVGTAAKRAMKELGNREAETVSYTRRNPNLRILIAGIVCRVLVFGKVMEYVVRWILWTEELAPFDPDQLLRIAEQRAILRRTGRNFFSFIHPLLMDHFARTEKLSHHTGTFIDAR